MHLKFSSLYRNSISSVFKIVHESAKISLLCFRFSGAICGPGIHICIAMFGAHVVTAEKRKTNMAHADNT